jgi:hypothetical protein
MKEQFRDVQFKGEMKISYKTGESREVWTTDRQELLMHILRILKDYEKLNIRLTNRQLYYQLVAEGLIPNRVEVYKRICEFLTDARYGGYIDWQALEDRGREPDMAADWENIKERVESALASYRLPRWQDQDYYVELYCEKDAMTSILQPISRKYHIYFGANKGYSSASAMYELAQRLKDKIKEGRECRVIYLGDMDPSGVDMDRDIRERIHEFLTAGEDPVEPDFELIRIALTKEQIKRYNPPPNPAKLSDSRSGSYIDQHGSMSWELDALKPEVVMRITEEAIQRFCDIDKYNAWIKKEAKDKDKLRKVMGRYDGKTDKKA